jgi:hypothetical protein
MDVVFNESEEIVALTAAARVINAPDPFTGLMIKTTEETQLIDRVFLPVDSVDLQIIEPKADKFTLDEIRIRFYPNGTSETLELRVVGAGEAYRLTLDPVTGRTAVINEEEL